MNFDYKLRSDLHVLRKIWHAGAVMVLFFVWTYFKEPLNKNLILFTAAFFIIGDLLRVYVKPCNQLFNKIFSLVLRKSEVDRLAGTTYLLSGVVILMHLFPKTIVSLAILFLAFADPIASYFGIKYGTKKIIGHKSIEGFLAAFVVCMCLLAMYIYFYQPILFQEAEYLKIIFLVIVGGLIGALAELVPFGSIDDNFTMPLVSATGLYFLFTFTSVLP